MGSFISFHMLVRGPAIPDSPPLLAPCRSTPSDNDMAPGHGASNEVAVSQECISDFNKLKLEKSIKYIIYKLSDDSKEIVVEETSTSSEWDEFQNKLIDSKSKTKSGAEGKGCRFAVYDFSYNTNDGERSKITFIAWVPDDAPIQARMVYASSKDALKRSLTGIASEMQANDADDLEYESAVKFVSKGSAI